MSERSDLRTQPWGAAALAAGLVSLAVGWWLGWPELAVPGGVATGVFLAGLAASLGRPGLGVTLAAEHRRVPVGGDPGLTLTLVNTGRRRVWPGNLAVPVRPQTPRGPAAAGPERLLAIRWPRLAARARPLGRPARSSGLAPGQSLVVCAAAPTKRRGLFLIGPVRAVRGDPFGLVARGFAVGRPLEIAVCPPIATLRFGPAGMIKDLEGRPTGQAAEPDASFHALRPYQAGDDVRAIHWRSSARLGRAMVRQSEDTRRAQVAAAISTNPAEYGTPEDFELAVAVCASIGLAALAQAGDVTIVAGQEVRRFGQPDRGRLLDAAAAMTLDERGGGRLAAAVARIRGTAPRTTLAVLVAGAGLTAGELSRAAGLLPRHASVVAVRSGVGGRATVGRVGRLRLVGIGELGQLPELVRRWERV